jgi:lysophospholipase L1-like esterase
VVQAKLVAVAIAALAIGAHPGAASVAGEAGDARPKTLGAKSYYLALGDSIAYGVQPANVDLPPPAVHGFVDLFAARLRKLAPKIRVVNYGCPGESTKTFIDGGCPWLAERRKLHTPFHGTQLAAALAFLRAHPGQVSPITVTLGGNDINEVADVCKGNLACIKARAPAALRRFRTPLSGILEPIRSAAPQAEIVLTGLYNFNADDLRRTDPIFRSVNGAIAGVARRFSAHYANLFAAFNPQGEQERARVCAYTFICGQVEDPHPTDAGYRAIAAAVWKAARYGG